MKKSINIVYAIIALSSIVLLPNCDGTSFKGNTAYTLVGEEQPVDNPASTEISSQDQGTTNSQPEPTKLLTDEEKKKEMEYVQNNKDLQAGKKVKVCIAYLDESTGHYCDRAKFHLYFNGDESVSHVLNLDNVAEREVETISGHILKVSSKLTSASPVPDYFTEAEKALIRKNRGINAAQHVPGTLYETEWTKDGDIKTLLRCQEGQQAWGSHKCHTGTASIAIIGEVQISDGSKKYLATDLVKFTTADEAVQSFSYTNIIKDGEKSGNVVFHLSDTEYEFDDYCGFKDK